MPPAVVVSVLLLPSVPMAMPMDDELVNPEKFEPLTAVDDVVGNLQRAARRAGTNRHAGPP